MSRFPRHLWNFAATLSLIFGIATLIALPVSFFRALGVVRTNEGSNEVMRVVTGFVALHDQRGPGMPAFLRRTDSAPHTWLIELAPLENVPIVWINVLRPHYIPANPIGPGFGGIEHRVLFIPLRLLAFLFSLPKTLPSIVRRLRRPPPLPGHCPACHYDRRATPTRCPECGTTRPPVPAADAPDSDPIPSAPR